MKITKEGTKAKDRLWKGVCYDCKSEAIAIEGELKHIQCEFLDPTDKFSWEVCPFCKVGDPKTGYGGMIFYLCRDQTI